MNADASAIANAAKIRTSTFSQMVTRRSCRIKKGSVGQPLDSTFTLRAPHLPTPGVISVPSLTLAQWPRKMRLIIAAAPLRLAGSPGVTTEVVRGASYPAAG